jgi:hypothetical protein
MTTCINNLKQHEKNTSFEQTLSVFCFLDIIEIEVRFSIRTNE